MMEWIMVSSGRFPEDKKIVKVMCGFQKRTMSYAYKEKGNWYSPETKQIIQFPILAWGEDKEFKKKKEVCQISTKDLGSLPDMPIVIRATDSFGKERSYNISSLKMSFNENGERCLCIIPDIS